VRAAQLIQIQVSAQALLHAYAAQVHAWLLMQVSQVLELELWLVPEPGLETRSALERELAREEQRHGCRLKPAEKPTATVISPTLRALSARALSGRTSLSTDPCYFFSPNSVIRIYLT